VAIFLIDIYWFVRNRDRRHRDPRHLSKMKTAYAQDWWRRCLALSVSPAVPIPARSCTPVLIRLHEPYPILRQTGGRSQTPDYPAENKVVAIITRRATGPVENVTGPAEFGGRLRAFLHSRTTAAGDRVESRRRWPTAARSCAASWTRWDLSRRT